MKEFDKWFDTDKLIDNLNTNYTNRVCSGLTWDTITEVSEYVWKSALEWSLSHDIGPCSFNKCNVRAIIEEELGE